MTVFLAILWVLTIALPPVVLTLPLTVQSIIAGYVAAVGLALIIHWRVSDNRKRDCTTGQPSSPNPPKGT